MTREMVAQWEAELDEFVVDIRSRLEKVAGSIITVGQPAIPDVEPELQKVAGASSESREPEQHQTEFLQRDTREPEMQCPQVFTDRKTVADPQPASNEFPEMPAPLPAMAAQTPVKPAQVAELGTGSDSTSDRLQAIKQKLAARLQGELS